MAANKSALKLTVLYGVIGILWILLSDLVLGSLGFSGEVLTTLEIYKGWFFILFTALLLYSYANNLFKKLSREEKEKERIEQDLREEKESLKYITETVPVGILLINKEGKVSFVNSFAEKLFKTSRAELIGQDYNNPDWQIFDIHGKPLTENEFPFHYVMEHKIPQLDKRLSIIDGDNNKRYLSINTAPLLDENNIVKGIISAIEDITEKIVSENELFESRELLDLFFTTSMDGFYISLLDNPIEWDEQRKDELIEYVMDHEKTVRANKALVSQYKSSIDEVIGLTPREWFKHDQKYGKMGWMNLYRKGQTHVVTNEMDNDGNSIWIEGTYQLLYDKDGKIKGHFGVQRDITSRVQFEDELIEAKKKAEVSEKLKSEFLAQMSHEIRTPINVILNATELIKGVVEPSDDKDIDYTFDIINSASTRLIRTIDLILNMSEIQTGSYVPTFRKINIFEDVLYNLMLEFKTLARSKRLEFNIVEKTDNAELLGDAYSVTQIFGNLIDNAIKYTEAGKIDVVVYRDEKKQLVVEVSDTGIGIAKEHQDSLFDPFTQVDQGYTRKFEGSGLGLALVKRYCELNDAKIEINSEEGEGSIFKVTFCSSY